MATAARTAPAPAPAPDAETGRFVDVSHPDLWRDNRWHAPFAALRAAGGIHYYDQSRYGPYWAITTAAPILEIETKPEIFSSEGSLGGITLAGDGDDRLKPYELPTPMFIAMDAPKHTEQRKTVAPSLGPSPVAAMKADAVARTAAVLDALPIGERFDWVERVSIELATQMLAKLFDFPWEERDKLTYWSDILGDIELFHSEETRIHRTGIAFEMGMAFHALWEAKKLQPPGKDLTSAMLHSPAMGAMSDQEFLGNMILLIVGGNDTTRNSMSAYVRALELYPDQRTRLENDASLIPNAVQEIIRWQTPLAHMRRTALADYDLAGHHIRAGDKVCLWYASANRDEALFPDGEAIDIARPNARRHLSFGHGIHRCVGARVAELEVQVLLEQMAQRRLRPRMVAEPVHVAGCFTNGYRSMDVVLERY